MPLDLVRSERNRTEPDDGDAGHDFGDPTATGAVETVSRPRISRAAAALPPGSGFSNISGRSPTALWRTTTESIGSALARPAAWAERGSQLTRALAGVAGQRLYPVWEAWSRIRPRLGLKSLYWRIFILNLAGLAVMLVGILYLSAQQDWLIEAKRDSIQAQAQVIADAIVREATSEDRSITFPSPDRVLDGESGPSLDVKSSDIQDFEFAIQPEKVAPILQRYSQSSGQRARIYSRDGTLIYDSAGLSNRVTRKDLPPVGKSEDAGIPIFQSLWERIDSVMMPSNLPIYREISGGNGRTYPEVQVALEEGQPMAMLMVNRRGSHMVTAAVPIKRLWAVQGALVLSTRDGDVDGIRRKERHLLTWIFIVALIATALTALMLAGTIARPMRKLSESALAVKRNIAEAKNLPTFPDHKDEIGQMASAFRDMTLALYKRVQLSEKFAADVAHELKNPVAAVRGSAESLSFVQNEADRQELLANIQTDLKRLNKLIDDIWSFSRLDSDLSLHEPEPIDVGEMATGIASAFSDMRGTEANPRPVSVDLARTSHDQEMLFLISGHESRVGQMMTNLVDNALSFSPPRGHVWVRVRPVGETIEIVVEDEGPGVPEDRLEKIFERFYTDRPDSEAIQGKNSGLGLSITREIVEAHAGRIWAENRLADDGATILGARFVVHLPAMSGNAVVATAANARTALTGRRP